MGTARVKVPEWEECGKMEWDLVLDWMLETQCLGSEVVKGWQASGRGSSES